MSEFTLVVGNHNLSSWSLRPYVVMKQLGIPFELVKLDLKAADFKNQSFVHSPTGKVPVLKHRNLTIWDSLSICEYLAETFPEKRLWPEDKAARATARSVSAEMHSGFTGMRTKMSMNFRSRTPLAEIPAEAKTDVERIQQIWTDCRTRFGVHGSYLFGQFSIADAMYAPVVSRFTTYGVQTNDLCRAYMETVWKLPAMQEWLKLAESEA